MEMLTLLFLSISVTILVVIVKVILRILVVWDTSPTCLIGKTAIITGGNTGIGYYTALNLAQRGARIILGCRDKKKADEAKEKIIEETGNRNVIVKVVDLSSLASVRQFSKEINSTESRLDILINNAGAASLPDTITQDGLNLLMQVNHFGQFLLTCLLTDLLKKSAPSRIVNLSSYLSDFAELDPNNLNAFPKKRPQLVGYANSKLCTFLFTRELAKKLKGTGVIVNSLHPGSVNTGILQNTPNIIAKYIMETFASLFFRTSEEGAQTVVHVAVSKEVENISGEYFYDCKVLPMIKLAQNDDLARKVWTKSEELVKMSENEKI